MKRLINQLLFCFTGLLLVTTSCSHIREGELIKTQDGKIYRLEAAAPHEAYIFREVDLTALDSLK